MQESKDDFLVKLVAAWEGARNKPNTPRDGDQSFDPDHRSASYIVKGSRTDGTGLSQEMERAHPEPEHLEEEEARQVEPERTKQYIRSGAEHGMHVCGFLNET